jgi:hypothetical protein
MILHVPCRTCIRPLSPQYDGIAALANDNEGPQANGWKVAHIRSMNCFVCCARCDLPEQLLQQKGCQDGLECQNDAGSARLDRNAVLLSGTSANLALKPPPCRVIHPAVDVGLSPAGTVDADLELGRERALGDLAVEGGPGEAGSGEDGLEADDTVWLVHGRPGSGW